MRLLEDRLQVFEGSFDTPAVRSVCAGRGVPSVAVPDLLDHLASRGRLLAMAGLRPARWRLVKRFEAPHALSAKHASYFESLCRRTRPKFGGPRQHLWLDRFEHEVANLRQAMRWSLDNDSGACALRISVECFPLWFKRSMAPEGLEWTLRSLQAYGSGADPLRLDGLNVAGTLHCITGSPIEGRRMLRQALNLAWELGDHGAEAAVLSNLGITFRDEGDLDEARKALTRAVELWRELGQDGLLANSMVNLAAVLIAQDRDQEASRILAEAAAAYEKLEDPWSRAMVGYTFADLAMRDGELARARDELNQSIHIFQIVGDRRGLAQCFKLLSGLEAALGRYRRAATLFGAAEAARNASHTEVAPIELAPLMQAVEEAREVLGEVVYDDSWTLGYEFSLEDAIRFALE